MNENITNPYNGKNQDDELDIKKFVYLILRQWYWFALFGAVGLMCAYGYKKLTKQEYVASTSIMVPEKSSGLNVNDLFKGAIDAPSNNIYNQIEIIQSYYNISKALQNLNWRTSWYKKDLFIWKGIYKSEPFDVQEATNFINPKGIRIFITPTSGDNFTVSVDDEMVTEGNIKIKVKFEENASYGKPFVNKYFNFTLLKKVSGYDTPDGKYYFVFNDLNDATLAYQKKLKVSLNDKKSDIILCTVQGEEASREVEFLNELIRVYTSGKMDFQNEAQRRSLDFINNQLAGISDSLNTAQNKFTDFRSRNSVIDLGAEGRIVMDNLKEVETERVKSQMQLDYFQNLLKYLETNSDLKQIVMPSVVGIEDASLNALVLKLGELYNRRQVLSFSAKENNPAIVNLDREMGIVRSQLSENLRNLITNATNNINSQKERQDKVNVQLNRLPQKEQQMVNIQRQATITNEIYTFLLQKRAETNISLASSMSDVQVIDIARTETAKPVGLGSSIILGLGFVLGAGLPMAFLIIMSYFDDKIRSQEDLEKNTRIPILGNIMHSVSTSDLAVFENPKSNIAESFRVLRTNLQFMLTGETGKVLSVLSTNPGEGKSFVSDNLATILAMNNKKVLMIGADLRKPRLHKIFNVSNEKGLSTYLIGTDPIDQIILKTQVENLDLIPAGPIPPNPAEILSKTEMKTLIDFAKTRYDYVVIDNAPTALVTDGHIVAQFSDLNIFVLRYGVSHTHQLDIINSYAEKKIIENMAILVNDIKANAFGHSYYKYYQYEAYQNSYYAAEEKGKKHKTKKA